MPYSLRACVALAVLLACLPLVAQESPDEEGEPTPAETLKYRVSFEGNAPKDLLRLLRQASESVQRRKDPTDSLNQLRLRTRRDLDHFRAVLHSEGYYAGSTDVNIEEIEDKYRIVFIIETGPRYTFDWTAVHIETTSETRASLPPLRRFGLIRGDPARAAVVLQAEKRAVEFLRDNGFPHAKAAEREVIVDHAKRTMDVRYRITPGGMADFGSTTITGLETVKERVVRSEIPWQEGEHFSEKQLRDLRADLYESELFSSVQLTPAEEIGDDGRVPIFAKLDERPHRTYGFGLGYSTDLGAQANAFWEHRNIQGLGRRLRLEADVGETLNAVSATYNIRHFYHPDQSLRLRSEVRHFDPAGFTQKGGAIEAILARELTEHLTVSGGLRFTAETVEQLGEEETYFLATIPLALEYDRTDDILDATNGYRLIGKAELTDDLIGPGTYVKLQSLNTYYFTNSPTDRWTLALRAKFGSILGESVENIPASDRFYAGGAGSVRGYRFQTVGPLVNEDPTGGASLLEGSAEIRFRFPKSFGAVMFLDGGTAFADNFWDSGENVLFGAGVGLRYHTPLGPIRVDFAVPLNRRSGVDSAFEVYFSIGQAF